MEEEKPKILFCVHLGSVLSLICYMYKWMDGMDKFTKRNKLCFLLNAKRLKVIHRTFLTTKMTKIGLIDLKNYKKIYMYMEIVFFYNISDTPMDRMKGSLKKFQWIE